MKMELDTKQWTAKTWYALWDDFERMSANPAYPSKLQREFERRAQEAFIAGDLRRGVTPEMRAAEYAICRAEDDAMIARVSQSAVVQKKQPAKSKKRVGKEQSSNKSTLAANKQKTPPAKSTKRRAKSARI